MRTLLHLFVLLLSLQGLLCSEVTVQLAGNSSEPDAVRARQQEIIDATAKLLSIIIDGNHFIYKEMCDPALSTIGPENLNVLVRNVEFNHFAMKNVPPFVGRNTMVNPHVRMLGEDAAFIAYERLYQAMKPEGGFVVTKSAETCIWQRRNATWRLVHFHRSASTPFHKN